MSLHPIEGYAAIGDCRSVALVSREGSIDWLCWPRFDSGSIFAALLDDQRGGHFAVRPAEPYRATRGYVGDTNVLETRFVTGSGELRVRDAMPVSSEREKREVMTPDHELLRIIECTSGEVEVQVDYVPRFRYGQSAPALTDRGALGFTCRTGTSMLTLCSEFPLRADAARGTASGREILRAGARRRLALVFAHGEPSILPPLGAAADARMARSLAWWEAWAAQCTYAGPYRRAVLRSALALKLLAFSPSGAVVAAATTSLPEAIGGTRNWDYRYCWLRDASMTLRALHDLGFRDEAKAFITWLLHSTALSWPRLQVVYDIYGETDIPERELHHLRGWRDSRPVRVGNDARDQLQLDVYGEIIDAVYELARRGGSFTRSSRRFLRGLAKTSANLWHLPDEGIWEIRSGRRHHTFSKAMCWVALDRSLRLARRGVLRVPVRKLEIERDRIREAIETRGWNDRLGSYTTSFGSEDVDASLLLLARYGYAPADGERMAKTCARLDERLGAGPFLYRYAGQDDGLPEGEGAFVISSFWMVSVLAQAGRIDEASARFEELCASASDAGLFAEQIDPTTGASLGNTPQAFSHVGLIDAALGIEEAKAARAAGAWRRSA